MINFLEKSIGGIVFDLESSDFGIFGIFHSGFFRGFFRGFKMSIPIAGVLGFSGFFLDF